MERTVADAYEQQQPATNHTPPKTNMTMKNPPFADVFPIKTGYFPASHVSFQGCGSPNFFEAQIPYFF